MKAVVGDVGVSAVVGAKVGHGINFSNFNRRFLRCLEVMEQARPKEAGADKVAWVDLLRLGPVAVVCVPVVATKNRIRSGSDVWILHVRSVAQK